MSTELRVGVAETEITPPVGTLLCGSLKPRPSKGIDDPLMLKAVVIDSGEERIAVATFDLAVVEREVGDRCIAAAAEQTEIRADHIFFAATHSHSGPYTIDPFPQPGGDDPVDREWLATLPGLFSDCVARADAERAPARLSLLRGYAQGIAANRRLRFKDGREINRWCLSGEEAGLQCVGAAGPTDPELPIVCFDDEQGLPRAVLYNYALHCNAHFGKNFSGDFSAVAAARLRERFGPQVSTLFLPGGFADINPIRSYRETGAVLADEIIRRMENRQPVAGPVRVAGARRELTVPYRDLTTDQEARIEASQWPDESKDLFRRNLELMREKGETEGRTWITAWRIGDAAFAGIPGEPFVEWAIAVKQRSPFPWTLPVGLCNDWKGYLVTHRAWEAGGYESLVSTVGFVSPDGVAMMVENALEMLGELRDREDS